MSAAGIYSVADDPFPHVLVDNYFDQQTYGALLSSFPACPANTGPTGFTMFWGDRDYDALISSSLAWGSLFARFQSQRFIDFVLAQFAETFARECIIDLSKAQYVSYQESRVEKESAIIHDSGLSPEALWVRMDIMQGHIGYVRKPHLDHRRRAISMLIYMSDADDCRMEGGELILNRADGSIARIIAPKHNRMVMFPCTPQSFHSVRTIRSQTAPRNFVQVTVSSSHNLWTGARPSAPAALWAGVRGIAQNLRVLRR